MKQKRFTTREEIIAKIDSVKEQSRLRSIEAEQLDKLADEQFAESAKQTNSADAGTLIKDAQHNRAKAKKLFRLVKKTDDKINKLKHTLSAFDTETMPFVPDRSVVLQK